MTASAVVAFQGNTYSVLSGLVEHLVTVRTRLGSGVVEVITAGGAVVARSSEHHAALEAAVLSAFTTAPPCRRKENRSPGPVALLLAAALRQEEGEVTVDLRRHAELAEVAR